MFVNLVWAQKLANIQFVLCIFDTNHRWTKIAYLVIRWQSWQTCLKAKKVDKHHPPSHGGLKGEGFARPDPMDRRIYL